MVQLNLALREISCKIVYFGPGLSGKTTNLEVVHEKAPQDARGELTSIATESDRTLFFDFMPLNLGTVGGMRTKFQLYTVPGQVYYNSTRKLVLRGADGVVFVADSAPDKMEENIESLDNLEECLKEQGRELSDFPHVIQFNKRDLPDAMSVEDLEKGLNRYGVPCTEAVASKGEGVIETFKALSGMVLKKVKDMTERHNTGAAARSGAATGRQPQVGAGGDGATTGTRRIERNAPPGPAQERTPAAVMERPVVHRRSAGTPAGPTPARTPAAQTASPGTGTGDVRTGTGNVRTGTGDVRTGTGNVGTGTGNVGTGASPRPSRSMEGSSPAFTGSTPLSPMSVGSTSSTAHRVNTPGTSSNQRIIIGASSSRRRKGSGGALVWLALVAAALGGLAFAYFGGLL